LFKRAAQPANLFIDQDSLSRIMKEDLHVHDGIERTPQGLVDLSSSGNCCSFITATLAFGQSSAEQKNLDLNKADLQLEIGFPLDLDLGQGLNNRSSCRP